MRPCARVGSWRTGFTLIEVIVGVLVLEVGLVGVAGMLLVASRHLSEALEVEQAAASALGVLDSLSASGARAGSWTHPVAVGRLHGSVDASGDVRVVVESHRGDTLIDVTTWVPTSDE